MRLWLLALAAVAAALVTAAVAVRPAPLYLQEVRVQRADIRFDGERALQWTREFVAQFPHRNAGGPNSRPAALWLAEQLRRMGYEGTVDTWQAELYGKPTELHNVVARRPGTAPGAVLLEAHLDHAPTTVYGADNDGSGVGILLTLAEELAAEQRAHPVVFLFADAEEYGMLGVRRFVAKERDPAAAYAAALTIDNAGKESAFGTDVEMLGQGRGYTPLGLFRLLQDLAPAADGWAPYPQDPVWQTVSRAVSISFTDQGPLVRAGIPAIALGATGVWPYYHTPDDTLDKQSAATLGHMGRLAEAFVRDLEAGARVDSRVRNYLYLADGVPHVGAPGMYVPGWAISMVQLALVLPFLLLVWLAVFGGRRPAGWGEALLKLAGLAGGGLTVLVNALPALAGVLALPLLARVGLIPRFAFYPAPPKDPTLLHAAWGGVAGFLAAVAAGAAVAVWLHRKLAAHLPATAEGRRPAALLMLAGLALAVWVRNGYALIFLLPALYAWAPIGLPWGGGWRRWAARGLGAVLFLLGGSALYGLLWLFGHRILHIGPYMAWYFLQMLAFGVVAPYTALAGCLAVGCGVTLLGSVVSQIPGRHLSRKGEVTSIAGAHYFRRGIAHSEDRPKDTSQI